MYSRDGFMNYTSLRCHCSLFNRSWICAQAMRRFSDYLLPLLIPVSILAHLAFAPYTKVEESFNIQATHDILTYGIPLRDVDQELRRHYDHITFSGAVPRTFLGPLLLAAASWPWIQLTQILGYDISRQTVVRGVLGLFNAYCLILFRNRVAKTFGRHAANWYVLFQASQFHLMYYASRTLPNTFAFGLTALVARNLLPLAGRSPSSRSSRQRQSTALAILTATTIVFRSELAILLASYTLYMFFHPSYRLTVLSIIFSGLVGTIIGLGLSVPLDTFFWRSPTPLWSELAAFKFNILSSKASEWGTSPWHFYFTSSLPRLLFNPVIIFLLPFTFTIPIFRPQALDILVPNLLYIAIYSFQPHKEWRFIEYTIPPLLAVASAGASWIWIRKAKNFAYAGLALVMIASVLGAFIASTGMCAISAMSYPGGEALERLHEYGTVHNITGAQTVHLDTLACMTGITRFGQQEPSGLENDNLTWIYDKTEEKQELRSAEFWEGINYAIFEPGNDPGLGQWRLLRKVDGFKGFKMVKEIDRDSKHARREAYTTELLRSHSKNMNTANEAVKPPDDLYLEYQAERGIVAKFEDMYDDTLDFVSRHITRGWWVQLQTEPKLFIMARVNSATKHQKSPGIDVVTSEQAREKEETVSTPDTREQDEPIPPVQEGQKGVADAVEATAEATVASATPEREL